MRCRLLAVLLTLPVVVTACGGGGGSASETTRSTPTQTAGTTKPATTSTTTAPAGPAALQGEAHSAAAGDIPDNQVFVPYAGKAFTMKVPEGWAQTGGAEKTTFRDKNNIVRVVIIDAPPPTATSVGKELSSLHGVRVQQPPASVRIGGEQAVKAVYATTSAPNAVTGKTVTLVVDRYELGAGGKRAIVDLGTPEGVDNVDAYRLMIESFRLR